MIRVLVPVMLLSCVVSFASVRGTELKDCPELKTPIQLQDIDPLRTDVVLNNLKFARTPHTAPPPDGLRLKIFNIKTKKGASGILGLALLNDASQIAGISPQYSEDSPRSPKEALTSGKTKYDLETKQMGDIYVHHASDVRYKNIPGGKQRPAVTDTLLKVKKGQIIYAGLGLPITNRKGSIVSSADQFAGYHETFCLESAELTRPNP